MLFRSKMEVSFPLVHDIKPTIRRNRINTFNVDEALNPDSLKGTTHILSVCFNV